MRSRALIDAAKILMRTSPGPGSGRGTSSAISPSGKPPPALTTQRFMHYFSDADKYWRKSQTHGCRTTSAALEMAKGQGDLIAARSLYEVAVRTKQSVQLHPICDVPWPRRPPSVGQTAPPQYAHPKSCPLARATALHVASVSARAIFVGLEVWFG